MNDHTAAFCAMSLFAIGAVVVILYQHSAATNSVLSALGGGVSAGAGANVSTGAGGLGVSASLAGTPTAGMDGSSMSPAVVPLNINPGFTLQ